MSHEAIRLVARGLARASAPELASRIRGIGRCLLHSRATREVQWWDSDASLALRASGDTTSGSHEILSYATEGDSAPLATVWSAKRRFMFNGGIYERT